MLVPRLNEQILNQAKRLNYRVSDHAPETYRDLNRCSLGTLVIYSGGSDNTVYGSEAVNWAFRALHDTLHLRHELPFTLEGERELARIQASLFDGDIVRTAIYLEITAQAEYFETTGYFPSDQLAFMTSKLGVA